MTLQINLPVVDRIHPQSGKIVTVVMIKGTGNGDSKVNDSPGW